MCGQTDSRNTWPLYLRSLFNLVMTKPLETPGLNKIFHIFAVSTGILQILPLIF